jgi:uncharacterized protein YndB with AHSA1/START domain
MTSKSIECSIWIEAAPERIWQALTKPEEILKWFVPALPGGQMLLDKSGKLIIELGPIKIDFALLESLVEAKQVTLRTLPDRVISTHYSLTEANGGTQVTAITSGFEYLLESEQEDRMSLSGAAWDRTLQNLRAFLAGEDLPFPYAVVSPLFGYWREMKTTLAAERSIWINAPRERVWTAITDPKQIQAWNSPATPWELSALEVGGRFYTRDAETNAENYIEIIELLNPPKELATRTISDPASSAVKGKKYTLLEENGGTRLIVTHSGYEQDPEEIRWASMEQNTFGFGMMLENAKAYIEGHELPFPFGF